MWQKDDSDLYVPYIIISLVFLITSLDNGKTITTTVLDECPACQIGLTSGAFEVSETLSNFEATGGQAAYQLDSNWHP